MAKPIDTLAILGASGDLTHRLLLPGVASLLTANPERGISLIGIGRHELSDDDWKRRIRSAFEAAGASRSVLRRATKDAAWVQADPGTTDGMRHIIDSIEGRAALYFALPPAATTSAIAALREVGVPSGTVLALEKPFGSNLRTARALNRALQAMVPENRVHRIDHFLGKGTVLNILGLRFANRLFEPVWNRDNIAKVEIIVDEQLGLEGRAGYYDQAGALVDMVQSHLLHLLAFVAMEPPSSLDSDDLRGAIAEVLRATAIAGGDPVASSRRARYIGGTVNGRAIPSYASEDGVDPERETETLAEVTVNVDTWRWAGVPFTLRSGKALGAARQEIIVTFRDVPRLPRGLTASKTPSALRIGINPDTLALDVNINGQGDPFTLDPVQLDTAFGPSDLDAYGHVLDGILSGDPTLSVRSDAAEECWRIVSPVIAAWQRGDVPLDQYRAGGQGPSAWR